MKLAAVRGLPLLLFFFFLKTAMPSANAGEPPVSGEQACPLPAPKGLTLTNILPGSATGTWLPVSGATGYRVRIIKTIGNVVVFTTQVTATTATATDLVPGTQYVFEVAAMVGSCVSNYPAKAVFFTPFIIIDEEVAELPNPGQHNCGSWLDLTSTSGVRMFGLRDWKRGTIEPFLISMGPNGLRIAHDNVECPEPAGGTANYGYEEGWHFGGNLDNDGPPLDGGGSFGTRINCYHFDECALSNAFVGGATPLGFFPGVELAINRDGYKVRVCVQKVNDGGYYTIVAEGLPNIIKPWLMVGSGGMGEAGAGAEVSEERMPGQVASGAAAGPVVSPNPFDEMLSVDFGIAGSAGCRLELIGADGRPLFSQKTGEGERSATIPTDGLAPGIYTLRVENSDGSTQAFRVAKTQQ